MESFSQDHVIGIPLASFAYAQEETQGKPSCSTIIHKKSKKGSFITRMSKLSQKTDTYMQGFKEHLTLGPNFSETIRGKLSFGAKVLIPLKRIKSASVRENLYNPEEKYVDLVTVDGFDFWFMGFISYEKSFRYLQHVISEMR
ncbi:unnamed protein product [Urochloa humidicola]